MSARWYSKHEIEIKDKQLNEENLLNASKYKDELKDVIDKDNHRENIDRAKKKSVIQHMDYDNFHQMVLGADLKGIKSSEMYKLKPSTSLLNTNFIHQEMVKAKDVQAKNYAIDEKEEIENKIKELNLEDEYTMSKFEREWRSGKEANVRLEYIFKSIFY